MKEETSNMWVTLIPECVALPPVASALSKFVNIGPISTPHNEGFFKASFDSSAETMVSDEYFHIFMMKQMQFIDAYWRIHVLVSCAHTRDCIQTRRLTCKLGLRHVWACAVPLLRHKSRLKSDFFHNFECTEYFS